MYLNEPSERLLPSEAVAGVIYSNIYIGRLWTTMNCNS